ncbi:unnamed protein product, partial [Discosporangium mesarthrocarpum]
TKVITQTKFGESSVLSFGEAPLAPLGDIHLLVRNVAAGVNPGDYKVRLYRSILPIPSFAVGWDAAGSVEFVGSAVPGFAVGDEVFYSRDITKSGTNAEKTVVDSRTVARKPKSLTFAEAFIIPLAALTAQESFMKVLGVHAGKTIPIYNGSGGVGSLAIQHAKHLGLTVVGTSSRPETVEWVKSLGADEVINHREDILPQLESIGIKPNYVLELRDNARIREPIKPLAPFACLSWPTTTEDLATIDSTDMFFGRKSMGYELMFCCPSTGVDPERQCKILENVAALLDEGKLRHTLKEAIPWTRVGEAHSMVEKCTVIENIALA